MRRLIREGSVFIGGFGCGVLFGRGARISSRPLFVTVFVLACGYSKSNRF